MRKQLFYKDIFDELGNRIPVLQENGNPIVVGEPEPEFDFHQNEPIVFEQPFYPLIETVVTFTIYSTKTICFPTYRMIEIMSDLFGKTVNVKYNDIPFFQTYSTNEGVLWIMAHEVVDQVLIEFNGIVKYVPIFPCDAANQ